MEWYEVFAWLAGGVCTAEFSGYWLHKVLHSEIIPALSRRHMIHHLEYYGPDMDLRPSRKYRSGTSARLALTGRGLEWMLPLLILVLLSHAIILWVGPGWVASSVFNGAAIFWGYIFFGSMHDNMHRKDFWMEKNSLLMGWFRRIRRLHDIHHRHIDSSGRMTCNFGICFHLLDRMTGTYRRKAEPPSREVLARLRARYSTETA